MDWMSKVLSTNAMFFHVRNSEGRNTEEIALHRNTPACITLSGKMLNDFSRNRAQGKMSTLINLHSTSTWPSHWKWVRGKKGVWLENKYWNDVLEDNGTIITGDPQQSGRTRRLGMAVSWKMDTQTYLQTCTLTESMIKLRHVLPWHTLQRTSRHEICCWKDCFLFFT